MARRLQVVMGCWRYLVVGDNTNNGGTMARRLQVVLSCWRYLVVGDNTNNGGNGGNNWKVKGISTRFEGDLANLAGGIGLLVILGCW